MIRALCKEWRAERCARLPIRSSAQGEIVPWVQSFGPPAELIAPLGWRYALRANVDATAKLDRAAAT